MQIQPISLVHMVTYPCDAQNQTFEWKQYLWGGMEPDCTAPSSVSVTSWKDSHAF